MLGNATKRRCYLNWSWPRNSISSGVQVPFLDLFKPFSPAMKWVYWLVDLKQVYTSYFFSKKDISRTKKELQFGTCNHDELPKVPKGRKGELYHRGNWRGVSNKQEFMHFHSLSWCQEIISFLQVGLCYCYMERKTCLLTSSLYFNWGFCFLTFTFPYFDQEFLVKVPLIKSQVFQFLWLLVP